MSVSVEKWKATGQFLNFNGHRIFWQQAGAESSPILVLIHGFPTSSWDWHLLWDDLARDFHVITLDMLGFGLSDKPRDHQSGLVQGRGIHPSEMSPPQVRWSGLGADILPIEL